MGQAPGARNGDGQDVETGADMADISPFLLQPLHSGSSQRQPFVMAYGFLRRAIDSAASRFDLDKHQFAFSVENDDVKLAVSRAPIAIHDSPSTATQPDGGVVFAPDSELLGAETGLQQLTTGEGEIMQGIGCCVDGLHVRGG